MGAVLPAGEPLPKGMFTQRLSARFWARFARAKRIQLRPDIAWKNALID